MKNKIDYSDITLEYLNEIALEAVNTKPTSRTIKIGTGKLGAITGYRVMLEMFNYEDIEGAIKEAEELLPNGFYHNDFAGIICPDGIRYDNIENYLKVLRLKK